MNSTVEFWTSGLLCGSPYDLVTGLYINSSGTERDKREKKKIKEQQKLQQNMQLNIC